MQYSDDDQVIEVFEGALSFRAIRHPQRAFAFEVTCQLEHPLLVALAAQKPPLHFHPYQAEYIQVLDGACVVEVDGHEQSLGPTDGEFCIEAWAHHRWYPLIPHGDAGGGGGDDNNAAEPRLSRVVVSGETTRESFQLDWVFFENWYAYQNVFVLKGQNPDLIQMFDAGGSYVSLPGWVPFGRTISLTMGIVVGRWLGGLLGYQPYYRKWTTDWQLACDRMEASWFYRRFADRTKKD